MSRLTVPTKKVWIPSSIPFFGFGIFYYLLSPAFVFKYLADDNDLLSVATQYLDAGYFDGYYFLDVLVIFVSFAIGQSLARTVTRSNWSVLDCGSFQTSYALWVAAGFSLLILYFAGAAYASGATFFTGYETYNVLILGPFATCAFLSVWFVNYFSQRRIRLVFLLLFSVCSVLLLGWGSRMYFVLSSMALILGLVSNNRELLTSPRF